VTCPVTGKVDPQKKWGIFDSCESKVEECCAWATACVQPTANKRERKRRPGHAGSSSIKDRLTQTVHGR